MNLDDLKELRRQLDHAIAMHEADMLKDMSEAEKVKHLNAYGENAAVIGDFVIRKRVPMPWDHLTRIIPRLPSPVIDSQAGDRSNPNSPYRQFPKNSS